MKKRLLYLAIYSGLTAQTTTATWKRVDTPVSTEWAEQVTPENVWQEYPRPLLEREAWLNLNGLWDFAVSNDGSLAPAKFKEQILVPFTVESALSGLDREVKSDNVLWYRRSVELPSDWVGQRVLLHFEASDFHTTVWLNGTELGESRGGYKPFSFDATASLRSEGLNEVLVKVTDPQASQYRSLGKQFNGNRGYERCSGIWQTVWLEAVSAKAHIEDLVINGDMTGVSLDASISGTGAKSLRVELLDNGVVVASAHARAGKGIRLEPKAPKLWSPDVPFLYEIKAKLLGEDGAVLDAVSSYCGLREFGRVDTAHGSQMTLNGEPIFQMGPLDQNYWPSGGLTPPSNEAMIWEVNYLKSIGCNMVRLHIKTNPRLFYANCDRLGLIVWQDFITAQKTQRNPSAEESAFWFEEQKAIVETLRSHPSIAMWIVFNEAWGQHDSERIFEASQKLDTSRIWSLASGWYDTSGVGDLRDLHDYTFRPAIPVLGTDKRTVILGEAGGFASAVPPYNWTGRSNTEGKIKNPLFGGFNPSIPRDADRVHDMFRPTFTHGEAFEAQYARFVDNLRLLKNNGLSAVIYTQMTDMKLEENGWLTFDRKVSKMDPAVLKGLHESLYEPVPLQTLVMPASFKETQEWNVCELPLPVLKGKKEKGGPLAINLIEAPFDSSEFKWNPAKGPFGNHNGASNWDGTTQLVLKKEFELESLPENASVRIYTRLEGDKGAQWIYSRIRVNGTFVGDDATRQFVPELRVSEVILPEEAIAALKAGTNTIELRVFPGLVSGAGMIKGLPQKTFFDVELTVVNGL